MYCIANIYSFAYTDKFLVVFWNGNKPVQNFCCQFFLTVRRGGGPAVYLCRRVVSIYRERSAFMLDVCIIRVHLYSSCQYWFWSNSSMYSKNRKKKAENNRKQKAEIDRKTGKNS